jgi:hypothetical protein
MSTWTPTDSSDVLSFDQVAASVGVYGSGDPTPKLVTRVAGTTFTLDSSLNDQAVAGADQFPTDQKWRRLSGVLQTSLTS